MSERPVKKRKWGFPILVGLRIAFASMFFVPIWSNINPYYPMLIAIAIWLQEWMILFALWRGPRKR